MNADMLIEGALIVETALTGLALILLIHRVLRGYETHRTPDNVLMGAYDLKVANKVLVQIGNNVGAIRALKDLG